MDAHRKRNRRRKRKDIHTSDASDASDAVGKNGFGLHLHLRLRHLHSAWNFVKQEQSVCKKKENKKKEIFLFLASASSFIHTFVFIALASASTLSFASLVGTRLKHGASLYLKFEDLNLSVVIFFNTFHWLKNFESCSVVSMALLCVSLLLRRRKVICCCETTFLITAELTYNLTYQIIISPISSIPDFVYSHFAHKNYLNC